MALDRLLKGFADFRLGYYREHLDLFEKLATEGQSPKILIIGCADARVDPGILTQTRPGDIFTVRNVAAMVPPAQMPPDQAPARHLGGDRVRRARPRRRACRGAGPCAVRRHRRPGRRRDSVYAELRLSLDLDRRRPGRARRRGARPRGPAARGDRARRRAGGGGQQRRQPDDLPLDRRAGRAPASSCCTPGGSI